MPSHWRCMQPGLLECLMIIPATYIFMLLHSATELSAIEENVDITSTTTLRSQRQRKCPRSGDGCVQEGLVG